ncbi:alpha-L-arabinofuranosidase C-terminal domain-containing protein [Lactobacillus sp. R2/2]|nr:alpha-L-arabinofuranosidase C-terminal domain-containing protein [Lactobacillus sp. R2/2]
MLKHADRVKAASIAQLVNVIGPIMAPAHAPAYRQTTFYPFAETASLTKNGQVLTEVSTFPKLENEKYGTIDVIDSVSVYCANNSLAIFIVNRSTDEDINYKIALPADHKYSEIVKAQTLHDDNFTRKILLKIIVASF